MNQKRASLFFSYSVRNNFLAFFPHATVTYRTITVMGLMFSVMAGLSLQSIVISSALGWRSLSVMLVV